jgi:hypothetical protein
MMIIVAAFMVSVAFTALNIVLYVANGTPVSLGAAIFCGAMAVLNLVTMAKYR